MTQTFKTQKGTELPMLDLRGKPYLQVAHRLVWFREEHPTWGIETEQLNIEETRALFTARIKDDTGRIIATATGHETKNDFLDFIEKAETKAVGRALAMVGYGTQFAPELDEGARIVDSPAAPARKAIAPSTSTAKTPLAQRKFAATQPASLEKRKEIAALVETKLGAKAGDAADILAKLNTRFALTLKGSNEISNVQANTIIETLKELQDMEPFKDEPAESQ